ncbi:MAG: Fe-S protein assembly co-chaperone HscB, partial [Hydrogenophilales bacterium CG17_big_fil_post_rev_8_21_14_2_50_63_12]
DFLVRQMAWREQLEAAKAAQDAAALDRLEKTLNTEVREFQALLAEEIDQQRNYPLAADTLRKLRFTDKLLADVGAAYEELG